MLYTYNYNQDLSSVKQLLKISLEFLVAIYLCHNSWTKFDQLISPEIWKYQVIGLKILCSSVHSWLPLPISGMSQSSASAITIRNLLELLSVYWSQFRLVMEYGSLKNDVSKQGQILTTPTSAHVPSRLYFRSPPHSNYLHHCGTAFLITIVSENLNLHPTNRSREKERFLAVLMKF